MSGNSRIILELAQGLASALSHRIRSPLSAISNDIFCLKTKSPAPECDRIHDRCREIGELLGESCALGHQPLQLSAFSLQRLLAEVFGEAAVRVNQNAFALGDMVRGDRARLRVAFNGVREAFGAVSGATQDRAQIFVNITLAFKKFSLAVTSSAELEDEVRDQPAASTLTRFFNSQLGSDSLGPVLADVVLQAHGVPVHVDAKNGLAVKFELPRNEE